jgi:hypothetical protein
MLSFRLGMILSKGCSKEVINHFRNKYKFAFWFKLNEQFTKKQFESDEVLIEPTGLYDDSFSGIGSFGLYVTDFSKIEKEFKEDPSMIDTFRERNKSYEKDCLKWIDIIKEMRMDYKIPKVGIFHFDGNDVTEKIDFPEYIRSYCKISDLTMEKLMKIKQNEIMFFI